MATKADVTNAIASLKAKLLAAVGKELDEIKAQIKTLRDLIAAGGAASAADLDGFIAQLDEVGASVPAAIDAVSEQDDPPVLAITSISPAEVNAGGPAFTLNVNGTAFKPEHKLAFNFEVLETIFVSETRLQAQISAEQIANPQTAVVSIFLADEKLLDAEYRVV